MPRSCSDAFYFHLVYEYLVHMGMDATSRRMLEECEVYGYPIPYLSEMGVSMEEVSRLLEYFDDENCSDFFKEFEIAVPVNIQNTTDCRKLKLGLHVYFAVTGLRYEKDVPFTSAGNSNNRKTGDASTDSSKKTCNQSCPCKNPHCMCRADGGTAEEKACMKSRKYAKDGRPDSSRQLAHPCMATLLAFLEKDGSELSKEPELLPYFALPFILDPEAHPHYEHLFKPPWSSNLRRWLWNFLISHRQASRVPELVLLLPDLHSALSGRTGPGVSSMVTRTYVSCPSDHEICMNHVTSNVHGKQRLRQYTPKDQNAKETKKAVIEDEKRGERKTSDATIPNKKPVTFHQTKEPAESDDKDGTSGCHVRCTCTYSNGAGGPQDGYDSSLMYGNLRSRYNQLHCDYHNLLGVAAELTDALESSVRGINVDLKKTLENCSMLFPELMKAQEEFVTRSTPEEKPNQEAQTTKEEEHIQNEVVTVTTDTPPRPSQKNVGIEVPNGHQTPKSNPYPIKPDHLKSKFEPNASHSDSTNPFCNSPMIPLHLVQASDKSKMHIVCDLDFKNIKHDLCKGSIKQMILLLQALRWRLTRTSVEQRTSAIESYTANDILGIRPISTQISNMDWKTVRISETTPLLERLLMPCSVKSLHIFQQASTRFINAIASLRDGRNYLVVSPSVVDIHVRTLHQVELDSISSEMVIATLQKLSLRSTQRRLMIEANLVEWLAVQLAENVNNRSSYWLKNVAALFINLCLHYEARERCIPFAAKILESVVEWIRATMVDVPASSLSSPATVLLPYIEYSERKFYALPPVRMVHISPRALPYLNGVMYILISHPEINQKAVEMSLAITLEELIVLQEDQEARCQLHHILAFHREQLLADPPNVTHNIKEDAEEGKWVLDILEDELDAADPVQAGPEDLAGEQLLCRYYSLPTHTKSIDSVNSTQTGEPVINIEECQLPVRPRVSVTPETLASHPATPSEPPIYSVGTQPAYSEYPLSLSELSLTRFRHSAELPECPPTWPSSTIALHEPSPPRPKTSFTGPENEPSCPTSFALLEIPPTHRKTSRPRTSIDGNPPALRRGSINLPTHKPRHSVTLPAHPRTSDTLPSISRTAVVFPATSPAHPRSSITLPETTRPRTSIAQPEISAEWSTTAVILSETSPAQPRTSNALPEPARPLLPPAALGTSSSAPVEGIGRPRDSSDVMAVSYTKHEQVVRCTPENFEVIVAVTLSPDKQNEEQPEHIVRTYKKMVKALKSPGKELQGVSSKSQHQIGHQIDRDDADATAENHANVPAPENPSTDSDSLEKEAGSSQASKDHKLTKESIFSSRPRIPRTPPSNRSRSPSTSSHPRSPPKRTRSSPKSKY